ncbi:MAG TPA: HetZ-related protein [Candidatus Obscuribacterales bacterium]
MNANTAKFLTEASANPNPNNSEPVKETDMQALTQVLGEELRVQVGSTSQQVQAVVSRIAMEVGRICSKSDRIQTSGQINSWQLSLGRHRLQKCMSYYQLGSKGGRVELHSNLSAIVYRYVAPPQSQLGFQARYNLIEDFLQEFYGESLKAFRRENQLADDYTPRTLLEVAEYMAFTELYAKRRITLRNGYTQQLIVLRAQSFAKRQPNETSVDIEQAFEASRGEENMSQTASPVMQQVRSSFRAATLSQMIASSDDPTDAALRDRVVAELMQYLESQGQSDCVDYLVLKMEDLPAQEIDAILGITARQRDYLQQRFKYHVEKFARVSHWKLVHQWLGADLDQRLGMSTQQWEEFLAELPPQYEQLLELKQAKESDREIAKALKWTPKQVQKRWTQLLEMASKVRNSTVEK